MQRAAAPLVPATSSCSAAPSMPVPQTWLTPSLGSRAWHAGAVRLRRVLPPRPRLAARRGVPPLSSGRRPLLRARRQRPTVPTAGPGGRGRPAEGSAGGGRGARPCSAAGRTDPGRMPAQVACRGGGGRRQRLLRGRAGVGAAGDGVQGARYAWPPQGRGECVASCVQKFFTVFVDQQASRLSTGERRVRAP